MLDYDFENSIGFWLMLTAGMYERVLNAEVTPRGITWRQCQVLGCLALEGALSQAELAERLSIEAPTLVGILDRMQRDGWVERHDDPDDRRKKLIRPTEKAEPIWSEIVTCGRRVRNQASAGMTAEEIETLKSLLARVQDNLRQHDAAAKAPARPKR